MPIKGIYCLCINNQHSKLVKIGALGLLEFEEGHYIYIGSALNSLIPRIERHLKQSRGNHNVTRWHIDYLLKEPSVGIDSIYIKETDEPIECIVSGKVSSHGTPVQKFGCSDCRCKSHLYKVKDFEFLDKMSLIKWF